MLYFTIIKWHNNRTKLETTKISFITFLRWKETNSVSFLVRKSIWYFYLNFVITSNWLEENEVKIIELKIKNEPAVTFDSKDRTFAYSNTGPLPFKSKRCALSWLSDSPLLLSKCSALTRLIYRLMNISAPGKIFVP